MVWSAAFYLGGGAGQLVQVPIESVEFAATELAAFGLAEASPVFAATADLAAFDFIGEPVFHPVTESAQFDGEC